VQFRVNESQMRWFGGGAGLAARQSPFMIFDSSVHWSLKGIGPTTKQRIPPGRSGAKPPPLFGGERSRRTVAHHALGGCGVSAVAGK